MSGRIGRALPSWVLMVLVWMALWGEFTAANLASGAIVATVLAVAMHSGEQPRLGAFRVLPAIRFVGYMTWNLVKANAVVAWEVLTPTTRVREGVIAVELPSSTPAVLTIVTTAIGLTPGTVVVEVDEEPTVLYIHVLHLREIEATRHDVRHLEALALAAFGPASASDDIARLEEDQPTEAQPGHTGEQPS